MDWRTRGIRDDTHAYTWKGGNSNVVHLCSCSKKLRWKFIVICDPRGRLLYIHVHMCNDWTLDAHTASNLSSQTSGTACFLSAMVVSHFGCSVIRRLDFSADWGEGNAINAFTDRAKRKRKMARIELNALQKCQRPQFGEDVSAWKPTLRPPFSFTCLVCFVCLACGFLKCTHRDNSVSVVNFFGIECVDSQFEFHVYRHRVEWMENYCALSTFTLMHLTNWSTTDKYIEVSLPWTPTSLWEKSANRKNINEFEH